MTAKQESDAKESAIVEAAAEIVKRPTASEAPQTAANKTKNNQAIENKADTVDFTVSQNPPKPKEGPPSPNFRPATPRRSPPTPAASAASRNALICLPFTSGPK